MKKLILTFAFVAVAQLGFAQEDPAFKADVLKLYKEVAELKLKEQKNKS